MKIELPKTDEVKGRTEEYDSKNAQGSPRRAFLKLGGTALSASILLGISSRVDAQECESSAGWPPGVSPDLTAHDSEVNIGYIGGHIRVKDNVSPGELRNALLTALTGAVNTYMESGSKPPVIRVSVDPYKGTRRKRENNNATYYVQSRIYARFKNDPSKWNAARFAQQIGTNVKAELITLGSGGGGGLHEIDLAEGESKVSKSWSCVAPGSNHVEEETCL